MRGPISEAVIIVILGFLIGGIPAAVIHFMIGSKWPSPAVSGAVDYLGPTGGIITFNEACAFAIEKCADKP
jgi:hypothetical protein